MWELAITRICNDKSKPSSTLLSTSPLCRAQRLQPSLQRASPKKDYQHVRVTPLIARQWHFSVIAPLSGDTEASQ